MIFSKLPLEGAFLVELEAHKDHRGFFARAFCQKEFTNAGIDFDVAQANYSYSEFNHTLRGLHYQTGNSAEKKFVKCMHGRILDVMIDLRKNSKTFGQHFKAELSHDNNLMVLVPEGFAHGFLTLEPNTIVYYLVTNFYEKASERAIRWNDPFFGLEWPVSNPVLSESDANCPDYTL